MMCQLWLQRRFRATRRPSKLFQKPEGEQLRFEKGASLTTHLTLLSRFGSVRVLQDPRLAARANQKSRKVWRSQWLTSIRSQMVSPRSLVMITR